MKAQNFYQSKDMANVKVFADKQTDKRTGQKLYSPDLSMRGHNNDNDCDDNDNHDGANDDD